MQTIKIVDIPYTPNLEPLFERIRDLPDAVWLDSGKPRSLYGRFDIISAAPLKILETRGQHTTLTCQNGSQTSSEDPFLLATRLYQEMGSVKAELNQYPFVGGLIGFWGYDLGRRIEQLPDTNPSVTAFPDMRLGQYTWALVANHSSQKAWLFFHPLCGPELRNEVESRLNSPAAKPLQQSPFQLKEPFRASINRTEYNEAINQIRAYISSGDCYQANFGQHFSAGFTGDSWQAYKRLRQALPSPFSAFLAWDDKAIMSLSPERFLKVSMNQVETKPIKGTAKRGNTVEEDSQHAVALMNSAKDRAENLMIVDLLRNDLGKACKPGSIHVPKLFALESYPNVHHLVSTVTGTLAEKETPVSLLRNCFPGGSITGAPKKRAMEIIEELESCRRSLYCGSIGYLSCTGRMDTNIVIRTVLADGNSLHCWGGGGIVADSDPGSEYQESLDKIQVLMSALQNS